MTQHYSNPKRESDPHALPDVETFMAWFTDCHACESMLIDIDGEGTDCQECGAKNGEGTDAAPNLTWALQWFYWACFPGCLPDSEPHGPFATEAGAVADAQSDSWQDGEDEDEDEDEQDVQS